MEKESNSKKSLFAIQRIGEVIDLNRNRVKLIW